MVNICTQGSPYTKNSQVQTKTNIPYWKLIETSKQKGFSVSGRFRTAVAELYWWLLIFLLFIHYMKRSTVCLQMDDVSTPVVKYSRNFQWIKYSLLLSSLWENGCFLRQCMCNTQQRWEWSRMSHSLVLPSLQKLKSTATCYIDHRHRLVERVLKIQAKTTATWLKIITKIPEYIRVFQSI